jgi:hypothetical protein
MVPKEVLAGLSKSVIPARTRIPEILRKSGLASQDRRLRQAGSFCRSFGRLLSCTSTVFGDFVMQKVLIFLGLIILVIGLLWPWLGKLPFGRLPGDIAISRPHLKIYIPITTMILLSLIVSIILWIFRR